jgi:eukaryotic-like serine/threonine-protein kinase
MSPKPPADQHSASYTIFEHQHIQTPDSERISARYDIHRIVGRGGMGVVLAGFDRKLQRPVAIKLGIAAGSTTRQAREVRTMAQLNIEGVVAVYDYDQLSDGRAMIAMQLIEGEDLSIIIRKSNGSIAADQVTTWMKSVCQTMQTIESYGIVHRDLKPSNIIINSSGRPVITDFGLASGPYDMESTQTGDFLGTPAYIAPEQIENAHTADSRADIYSFGATFYHAWVGIAPFQAESVYGLLMKHKTEPVPPPLSRRMDIPVHISQCIERCMAKNPMDRFQSFRDVAHSLSDRAQDAWATHSKETLYAYETIFRLHRSRLLGHMPSVSDSSDLVLDFPQGRRLTFQFGALEDETSDALVSSDDSELSMGGGVSAELSRVAGPAYRDYAQAFAPVRIGRVAVTPAFGLNAKYVFHGITIGIQDKQYPSRDIVAEIVDACFYQAETYSIASIAFPLLGTGSCGK